MTGEEVFEMCAGLPGAVQDQPFGEGVAVFKVGGKMFALVPTAADRNHVSLKCDPELALHLRARFPAVQPGYHLSKRHWNTVALDGSIENVEVREMIQHSYDLVRTSLSRTVRASLEAAPE